MARSPERADDLRGYDVEVAIGDFAHPESLDDALRGVSAAFLACPPGPQQVAFETAFIDAAARAPQRPHIVKLASLGAAPDAGYTFGRTHGEIIAALQASGVPHTVLCPTGFMQNLEAQAGAIGRDGVLSLPGGDAVVAHVDARDVAEVAAAILAEPGGHAGASYDLTGPAALSYAEVAEVFAAVLGRPVRYVDVPPEQARTAMTGAGTPGWLVDAVLDLAAYYRSGAAAVVTDAVERLAGRPAHSLEDFLRDHPAVFAPV